jgi:hypothetical protein
VWVEEGASLSQLPDWDVRHRVEGWRFRNRSDLLGIPILMLSGLTSNSTCRGLTAHLPPASKTHLLRSAPVWTRIGGGWNGVSLWPGGKAL